MTVIVGLKTSRGVWIGGDSAGVAGHNITTRADEKVFRNGDFLIGIAGSFRMGNLLRYSLKVPENPGKEINEFMVVDFVDAVKATFAAGGFPVIDNMFDGAFLVGYKGELFGIQPDFQVARNRSGFDAIGIGANYANGSLRSTKGNAKKRVLTALETAAEYSGGVTPPFTVMFIEK